MQRGTEGISSSETESTNALGVTRQTADDYTPGEDETAEETTKNILALLQEGEISDGQDDEGEQQPIQGEEEAGRELETAPENETAAQKSERLRNEKGQFVKTAPAQGQEQKPAEQVQAQDQTDPDMQIPAGLPPEHVKAFTSLPKGLKRHFNTMVKNQQAHFTRKTQEAAQQINQAKSIVDGGSHYIRMMNLKDAEGKMYTPERMFDELLAAHNELITNPELKLAKLIQETGAKPENINKYLQGEAPTTSNISADPTIRALQNEILALKGVVEQQSRASLDARVAPGAEEIHTVMHEVDPQTGEYRFPELHDDNFLESTKPLVAAFRRTNPNLGIGEALKKATAVLTGKTYSSNGNQPSLPARQSNSTLDRARQAAVSVRGALAPSGSQQPVALDEMEAKDIPDSIEETVRWAMRQHQAG